MGAVTNVFFSVFLGSLGLASIGPNLTALLEARGAMQSIHTILKRIPLIGTCSFLCLRQLAVLLARGYLFVNVSTLLSSSCLSSVRSCPFA